jgi:hypothetical protein
VSAANSTNLIASTTELYLVARALLFNALNNRDQRLRIAERVAHSNLKFELSSAATQTLILILTLANTSMTTAQGESLQEVDNLNCKLRYPDSIKYNQADSLSHTLRQTDGCAMGRSSDEVRRQMLQMADNL